MFFSAEEPAEWTPFDQIMKSQLYAKEDISRVCQLDHVLLLRMPIKVWSWRPRVLLNLLWSRNLWMYVFLCYLTFDSLCCCFHSGFTCHSHRAADIRFDNRSNSHHGSRLCHSGLLFLSGLLFFGTGSRSHLCIYNVFWNKVVCI